MIGLALDALHAVATFACSAVIGWVLCTGEPSDEEDVW